MIRLPPLLLMTLITLTAPAAAQQFQGNWFCTDGVQRAGLLTIYAGSYGFASKIFGDTASGTGSLVGYTDGVAFADGALKATLGIEAGRLVTADTGGILMRLESTGAIVMMCAPR
jgi:hypothetical protein